MATVPASNQASGSYGADQITVLEGLEAVRKRPGMYIGPTDINGLHHMVRELVDNSVDEALAGYADTITVTIHANMSVSVHDNGRGIPVGINRKHGKSAMELAATVLHAGGKFGDGGYKVSAGLHGVGLSVVNALSDWMYIEVTQNGKVHRQDYKHGVPTNKVRAVRDGEGHGTLVRFLPDVSIFKELDYTYRLLAQKFREMAYLTKGLRIRFIDEREELETSFYFEGGIKSFVRHLNREKDKLHKEPVYVERTVQAGNDQIALQYTDSYDRDGIHPFANNINNVDGGAHLTGFRMALTRVINNYARAKGILKEKEENLSGDDVREGLTAVVSVKLIDPQFSSQTKEKLVNPEARRWATRSRRIWMKTRPTASASLKKRSSRHGRAKRHSKRVKRYAKARWKAFRCPASWPTARTTTRRAASCILSRATRPAARPSKAATGASRRFCPYAARS